MPAVAAGGFLVVWCAFWALPCVAILLPDQAPFRFAESEPHYFFRLVFPLIGAGMTLFTLRALLVRHAWMIGPGRITRRTRVRLSGFAWEKRHEGVEAIEFRRGIWESGNGRTDVLQFRVRERATPIELDGLSYDASFHFSVFRRNLDSAKEKREQALGRFLADRVGVPYVVVDVRIPDPD
jgi:hypothetical protein